ncbi:hypothetical protein [Phenylobacterium sp.]|uniref:hypothetical protein n=1 Tax=Phenylobacterium sp. TaxID=1871053 RepID=UPI0035675DF1
MAAGVPLTAANCAAYDLDPAAYRLGTRRFTFDKKVYGPASVKQTLKVAQHHKCCFCEARFDANHAGDVEHYRPKGAITGPAGKIRPGYYWLAYAWPNLFYACADCNQYRKRSLFPLADEAHRATDHHHDLGGETPLILDPCGAENPRLHIAFKGDVPAGATDLGRATVEALKLDREALNLARRSHLTILDRMLRVVAALEHSADPEHVALVTEARETLQNAVLPRAVFSAAAQDFLAGRI